MANETHANKISAIDPALALKEAQLARNEALSFHNFASANLTTLQREQIESAQNILARIIKIEGRNSANPLRVLFLVPHTSLFDVFAPIYKAMQNDKAFAPEVLAFRRVDVDHTISADETKEFFAALNIDAHVVGFGESEILPALDPSAFDVLFYTLGSTAYPAQYRIEKTSQNFLTCYIAYGVLLANEPEYQYNQEFHHAAWRIYARSEEEKALYDMHRVRSSSNCAPVGYPKFDLYKAQANSKPLDRPTIIWAPHWTIGLIYPALNFGIFDQICMEMLNVIDENKDVDFIFKPHPNLLYALNKTTFMSAQSYQIYLDMLAAKPNMRIFQQGDNIALFESSSAMITDSISFLAEYMPSERPLLFLDRPDRAKLNKAGEDIIALHYSGSDMAAIRKFIAQTVLQNKDPMKPARQENWPKLLANNGKSASDAILADLQDSLIRSPKLRKRPTFGAAIAQARKQQVAQQQEAKRRSDQYWLSQQSYNYKANFPDRHKNQIEFTNQFLLPQLNKKSRVLDIGTADGWHACMIAEHCGHIEGIDMNPAFVKLARANAKQLGLENCSFEVGNALKLELAKDAYDAIVLSGLTTYFVDDADFLKIMQIAATALRPNGVLLLKDTLQTGTGAKLNMVDGYAALYRDLAGYNALLEKSGFVLGNKVWLHTQDDHGSLMAIATKRNLSKGAMA